MTLRVVQVFEVVEVEEQDGALAAVARRERKVTLQLVVEAPAVGQTGQRIVVGEEAQLLFERAALADV